MEAQTEGAIQPKQEPIEEENKPIDLYSSHEIKDEFVIGPVVLQKPEKTYIGVNSKGRKVDTGTHTRKNRFTSCNQRPNRSEPKENSNDASLTTQPADSKVKVEIEIMCGTDMSIKEEVFGGINMTSVDGHHSREQCAQSSEDTYRPQFRVDFIKVKIEHLEEAEPNMQDGEEDPLDTNHTRDEPNVATEDKITHFSCDICNKHFSKKPILKRHLAVHTKVKPHSCDICHKKFSWKHILKRHILMVHIKEKPHSCDICNMQFSWIQSLKRHLVVHTKEKPHSCNICNKQFSRNGHLKSHLAAVHSKEKPFSCYICDKVFSRNVHLKTHVAAVHTKVKPYTCDVCNKQFTQKAKLKIHSVIHTKEKPPPQEKPFSCDICNRQFSRNDHLKGHLAAVHTKEKPFTCDVCNRKFSKKCYLRKHSMVHKK